MGPTTGCATSPGSSVLLSHFWPPLVLGPSGSKSARRSSTCDMRIRCTWRRTPKRPTLSLAGACNWASVEGHPNR